MFGDTLPIDTEALPPMPPNDLTATFAKMIFTFVILVLLLYGTYYVLRKFVRQRLNKGVGEPSIHILEKKMISAKTMLYLIEVEGKKTLLAESHLEIKHLGDFPADISTPR